MVLTFHLRGQGISNIYHFQSQAVIMEKNKTAKVVEIEGNEKKKKNCLIIIVP